MKYTEYDIIEYYSIKIELKYNHSFDRDDEDENKDWAIVETENKKVKTKKYLTDQNGRARAIHAAFKKIRSKEDRRYHTKLNTIHMLYQAYQKLEELYSNEVINRIKNPEENK
jgi:hypothetical protein